MFRHLLLRACRCCSLPICLSLLVLVTCSEIAVHVVCVLSFARASLCVIFVVQAMANYAVVPYAFAVKLTDVERKLAMQFTGPTMRLTSKLRKVKVDASEHLTPFELRVGFAGTFGIPSTPPFPSF